MKRVFLTAFVALFFYVAFAQSPGYGVYSGWPTYLGLQFQASNLRLGLGLSGFGLAGDAGLILAKNAVPNEAGVPLDWYYGVGVGVGVWTFYNVGGITVFPHGLLGVEYRFPGVPWAFYGELNAGVSLGLGALSGFGPDFAGRVGVIFR